MKNLKKVLAMVLAFACTFTMFAGAKVFEDVPAGSDYSEAITMLSDLGIIQGKDDGKYHPEDTITRAEACALIARMMTGDPNVSQYVGAQNFSDVVSGSWKDSAIGYCYINNIVIGVGNNKFEPDRAITDAEFITMVVRAMGYETPDMAQGYPYTYMSNAQAIGLMDGVDMVANTDALRGEDAQVIYNALFADYARGAKLVNTTHGTSVEQYPTLAESVWGLERAAVGVWQKDDRDDATMELTTCKAHTWVITGKSIEVGNVNMFEAYPIEDDETYLYKDGNKGYPYLFTYNGDMENIADLKGYQVELWGMGAHDEPELETVIDENGNSTKAYVYSSEWDINAIKTVKGQTAYDYTPADEDLPDVDLDDVHGFFGGTAFKGENLKWGDKDPLDEDDVKDAMQTRNSASYRVADWDSDGAADFIVGDIYDYYKVDAVTNKTVRLIDMNDEKFVLDKDGETDVEIGGQDYTVTAEFPDDLEEGDIIQVSKSDVVGKKKIASTWTIEVVEAETKELTKVDTKKGAYFDDELIHDAEYYNDVRYYFEENDRKIDGLDVYDELNEDSEDSWDLYRDANGFIIDMAPSDEAWAGYIYVTGAANGRDKTGSKRQYAEISGVNDKNEYMKNITVVKDADIEINGKDAFDDYAFTGDNNPKGRVFHYAVNEDGEITKMIELALDGSEDYDYTDKTDSANIDTTENNELNYRYWLDDADVIFAVKANVGTEYKDDMVYDDEGDVDDLVVGPDYGVGKKDLDDGNVIAISVDEIPDISNDVNDDTVTKSAGIRYDGDVEKDEQSAVVLGVNTLRYFSHTSVEAGLLTNMTYNKKDDTYTATAYVAGRDGEEFTTIDADDVTIAGDTKLDELYDVLTKGDNAKNGIYCEFEFNKDGKITALSPMNNAYVQYSMNRLTNDAGIEYNVIANDDGIPATYEVSRVVVNKVTSDKALTVSGATATSEDNKVYSVANGQYMDAYDIDDSTAYYKITDEKVNMQKEQVLNPWLDGFKDGYEVEEGSLEDLDSYIRNYTSKYEDEYVVADVVLDGDDVVAVYYYDELVGEYGYLDGSVQVNKQTDDGTEVVYGTDIVAAVTCNDPDLKANSEEITLYSVTKNEKGEEVKTEIKTVKDDTADFGVLDAGDYYVKATGINDKTDDEDRQPIDDMTFTVVPADLDANDDAKIEVNPKNNQQVVLSGIDVADLGAENFTVYQNSTKLTSDMYTVKYDKEAGTYNFLINAGVSVSDDFTIVVSNKNYNDEEVVYEGQEVAPVEVKTTLTVKSKVTAQGMITISYRTADGNDRTASATFAGETGVTAVANKLVDALSGTGLKVEQDGVNITVTADYDANISVDTGATGAVVTVAPAVEAN